MYRFFIALFFLAACSSQEAKTPPDSVPPQASLKNAPLEALIVEFQEAIPDSLLKDPAYWNSIKAKTPAEIWDTSKEHHRHPAKYFVNLVSWIKESAVDTARWNEGYNDYDWEEAMFTNYAESKCAKLILHWYGYLDARKLDADWKNREAEWKARLEEISKQKYELKSRPTI